MATRTRILITSLLLLIIAVSPVLILAQEGFTVSTDKAVYLPGETVIVSGIAPADQWIGISIVSPNGVELDFKMVKSGADGRYVVEIKLPSTVPYGDWVIGKYVVRAYLGPRVATTTFELGLGAKVVGKVIDTAGIPIEGATVVVVETGDVTSSGKDGVFALLLKEGRYTLRISKVGYVTKEVTVDAKLGPNDIGTITLMDLQSLVEALNRQVIDLQTRLSQLQANVTQLAQVATTVENLVKTLQDVTKTLTQISQKLDQLATKTDVNSAKEDILKAIEGVRATLSRVDTAVAQLSDVAARLSDTVNRLQPTVEQLRTDITALRTDLRATAQDLSSVKSKVEGLEASVGTVQKTVDAIQKSVSDLKSSVDSVSRSVGTVSTGVSDVGSKVDNVGSKVDSVSVAVGGLQTFVILAMIFAIIAAAAAIYTVISISKALAK